VDKVAYYFVPPVMIIAVLSFMVWFTFGPRLVLGGAEGPALAFAIITSVTVLIIACPCAIGMAVPLSLVGGVGKGAEHGVLIRSGEALQTASQLKTIVLDKTGTITKGKPELTDVVISDFGFRICLRQSRATIHNPHSCGWPPAPTGSANTPWRKPLWMVPERAGSSWRIRRILRPCPVMASWPPWTAGGCWWVTSG
jgi:magnesium-transporting ATPase (P-type)